MDVLLALLLLLGGYTLGAASHAGVEEGLPVEQTGAAAGARADAPAKTHESVSVDSEYWHDCDTDRHYVIYRDLSRNPSSTTDCKASCADE